MGVGRQQPDVPGLHVTSERPLGCIAEQPHQTRARSLGDRPRGDELPQQRRIALDPIVPLRMGEDGREPLHPQSEEHLGGMDGPAPVWHLDEQRVRSRPEGEPAQKLGRLAGEEGDLEFIAKIQWERQMLVAQRNTEQVEGLLGSTLAEHAAIR